MGMASADRPRERLARAGTSSLGDSELVALLLGSGVRAHSALGIAEDVLELAGGVRGLPRLGLDDLRSICGIGAPQASRLLAAVELGRRALSSGGERRPRLLSGASCGAYLLPRFGAQREERFGVLLLDTRLRVIRAEILSVGTVDSSLAHPREVFRRAALASAARVVLFHNHPSGDPTPSPEDLLLTSRLKAAGHVMDIPVVDHVILGDGCWLSLRDAELL
ncbi:MAG: RadC family protein [Acidobacteriota bacterium]